MAEIPEDLKQKYSGSTFPTAYERLVPDLAERIAALTEENTTLKAKIAQLFAARAAQPKP